MGLGLEILCLFIFFVLPRNNYFCDAQASVTSLTESNTPQAIGSDVVITAVVATSSIPASVTWNIKGEAVGVASVDSGGTTSAIENPSSSFASRIDVGVGTFASSQFTTTLNITGLSTADNNTDVVITTVGSSDASLLLVVLECSLDTTAYPSLNFTCDDSSCEFNSAGTLSCAEGFTTSGLSTTSTTCQANATLSNLDVLSCAAIATTAPSTTAEAPTTSPTGSRVPSSETCLNGGDIAAIVICSLICVGCMVGFPVAFVVGSLTSSTVAIVGSTVGFLSGFVLVITFSVLYDTNYICNDGFTEVISYLEVGGAIAMGVILAALTLAAFITEVLLYLGAGCFAGKEPLKKSSKNQITPRHDPTFNGDSNQVSNSKANNKSKRNYEDSKTDPV